MNKHVWLLFLLTIPAWACSQIKSDSVAIGKNKRAAAVQYGVASYYHNKFENRKTANGEVFSQQKMTAACNTLPLNSWVKVTNTRNKKSVILRINDRMHHKNKRLIDLSLAAAKQLKYTGHGLTQVKVEYLGKKKPKLKEKEDYAGIK